MVAFEPPRPIQDHRDRVKEKNDLRRFQPCTAIDTTRTRMIAIKRIRACPDSADARFNLASIQGRAATGNGEHEVVADTGAAAWPLGCASRR